MCIRDRRMLAQGAALKLRSEGEIKPPKVPGDAQAAYYTPVSYTHLDVYKRQIFFLPDGGATSVSSS